MSLSISRIQAIFIFKMKTILKNIQIMMAPCMGILFVLLMKSAMPDLPAENGVTKASFLLGFGLLFNAVMGGMMMTCYPMAEEKEKNTLRVLMTSSVKGSEFLIGSAAPAFLILEVVNFLMIPISGYSFQNLSVPTFFVLTSLVTLISILIGFIVGLIAKNQMSAGLLMMPIMLFVELTPCFRMINGTIKKISEYLYSGILTKYLDAAFGGNGYKWSGKDIVVLALWLIGASAIFLYFYKKNGLDNE